MNLIDNELSEPYSIFTYRYFLRQWPFLCILAFDPTATADSAEGRCFGCVVAKMDVHKSRALRGYIGMLTVEKPYRHLGVGERFQCGAIQTPKRTILTPFLSFFSTSQVVNWCDKALQRWWIANVRR
jgi:hypothetical protein